MTKSTFGVILTVIGLAACGSGSPSVTISEFSQTHTATLEGQVTTAAGQPVDSLGIGYRFLRPIEGLGGDHPLTDGQGRFRAKLFRLSGFEPALLDTISVIVYMTALSSKYPKGSDGLPQLDSATTIVRFVALPAEPPVTVFVAHFAPTR